MGAAALRRPYEGCAAVDFMCGGSLDDVVGSWAKPSLAKPFRFRKPPRPCVLACAFSLTGRYYYVIMSCARIPGPRYLGLYPPAVGGLARPAGGPDRRGGQTLLEQGLRVCTCLPAAVGKPRLRKVESV